MGPTASSILTVGHSNHPLERFLGLLRHAGVSAIADVRTSPYSRHSPHYNADTLKDHLRQAGIAYSYLGRELGGRPRDAKLYRAGVADYERMAATKVFRTGLDRVIQGAGRYRLALMCAEQDPLDCHRCLLIARALARHGYVVEHILADGTTQSHGQIEQRLLDLTGRSHEDLFAPLAERLATAYRERAGNAAFTAVASAPCEGDGVEAPDR